MLKKVKYDKSAFLFLLPAVIIILFIYANPLVKIFWYSVVNWDGLQPTTEFSGASNFITVISNKYFFEILFNNLIVIIITIPAVILFALFCSQFIYLRIFGYKIYQYLFFLPVIIPNVVAAIIWTFFLHPTGPINTIFTKIGLDFLVVDWFGNPRFAIYGLIITIIWKEVGFATILFLARLSGVDPSLYDSAKIDGANDFQTIRYITIPQLKGVIRLFAIIQMIGLLNFLFGYIYIMTRGGPGYSSTLLEYFVYIYAFTFKKLGPANAVAVILFGITFIFVLLYFWLSRSEGEGELN